MNLKKIVYFSLTVICIQMILSSCADLRKSEYFADQRDSVISSGNRAPQSLLQPNDILGINVSSINPAATAIFNSPNTSPVTVTTATGNTLQASGYLINSQGFIQFPVLGELRVIGLTTEEVRILITRQLTEKKLLVEPVVVVRQLNFKVSVLGEVGHPTVISVPSEKISLLEALGLAGDITIYGRKDNVMIIREENGIKKIRRLDLNSRELFNSPYYYLKSNDVVYVEANKARVNNSTQSTALIPSILGGLSLIAIVVEIITRK